MEFQFGLITSSGKNLWITIKSITLEKSQFDRTCLISAVQNLISKTPLSQGIYWACPFFSKHQQCIEIVQRLVLRDEKGSFMGLTTSFYIHYPFFVIIMNLSHIGNNVGYCQHELQAQIYGSTLHSSSGRLLHSLQPSQILWVDRYLPPTTHGKFKPILLGSFIITRSGSWLKMLYDIHHPWHLQLSF